MQNKDREQNERALFSSRNEQNFLNYLKSLQKDSLPSIMKCATRNGEARTDEDKARPFTEFFASVVTDEDYAFFEPSRRHFYGKREVDIAEAGIKTKLKKLNSIKRQGNDSVPPILLRKTVGVFSKSLKNLFNNIKRLQKLLNACKIGFVSPNFIDGD